MLTDLDRAILDVERRVWRHQGAKEDAIRALGISPTRYYQRLLALLDTPAAWQEAPGALADARRRLAARRSL